MNKINYWKIQKSFFHAWCLIILTHFNPFSCLKKLVFLVYWFDPQENFCVGKNSFWACKYLIGLAYPFPKKYLLPLFDIPPRLFSLITIGWKQQKINGNYPNCCATIERENNPLKSWLSHFNEFSVIDYDKSFQTHNMMAGDEILFSGFKDRKFNNLMHDKLVNCWVIEMKIDFPAFSIIKVWVFC